MQKMIKDFIICAIVFIVICMGLIGGVYGYIKFRDKMELKAEQKTCEDLMISDVQPLLYYAGAIMGGQVLEKEGESKLYQYNFPKESFPTVVSFYVDIKFTAVNHDFHTGYVDVLYTLKYIDEAGTCVYYNKDQPTTWEIEKRNGKWYVTTIYEDLYNGI